MAIIKGASSRVERLDLGSPAITSNTSVHAAITDTGSPQTVTTGITNPDVVRNINATAGGTTADIKAIQVVVHGTNLSGDVISETLPVFTVNTAGTVSGSKAFKTVTSVVIPAHDGTSATTSFGYGSVVGLGVLLATDSVVNAYLNSVREATRPTVKLSATAIESNTASLASSLDGNAVLVDYYNS